MRFLIKYLSLIIAAVLVLSSILSGCRQTGPVNHGDTADASVSDLPSETAAPTGGKDEGDYDPRKALSSGAVYLPSTAPRAYGMEIRKLNAGDTIPCDNKGEVRFFHGDMYKYGDYVYTYHLTSMAPNRGEGWSVWLSGIYHLQFPVIHYSFAIFRHTVRL